MEIDRVSGPGPYLYFNHQSFLSMCSIELEFIENYSLIKGFLYLKKHQVEYFCSMQIPVVKMRPLGHERKNHFPKPSKRNVY